MHICSCILLYFVYFLLWSRFNRKTYLDSFYFFCYRIIGGQYSLAWLVTNLRWRTWLTMCTRLCQSRWFSPPNKVFSHPILELETLRVGPQLIYCSDQPFVGTFYFILSFCNNYNFILMNIINIIFKFFYNKVVNSSIVVWTLSSQNNRYFFNCGSRAKLSCHSSVETSCSVRLNRGNPSNSSHI